MPPLAWLGLTLLFALGFLAFAPACQSPTAPPSRQAVEAVAWAELAKQRQEIGREPALDIPPTTATAHAAPASAAALNAPATGTAAAGPP